MDRATLISNLKAAMERAHFKPHSLSKAAGLKAGYVSDIFRNNGEPGVLSFYALARQLGLTVEQLIGAAPIDGHVGDESPVIPERGDVIHDPNEAAILGVWRSTDFLGKTSILSTLGFKEVPSIAHLDDRLGRSG